MTYSINPTYPDPHQPWRMSEPLYNRVIRTPTEEGLLFRKCKVLPSDPEFAFVWKSFYNEKPTNYSIKRIFVIHNSIDTEKFEKELLSLEVSTKDPAFNSQRLIDAELDQRKKILERWTRIHNRYTNLSLEGRSYTLDKVSVIPLWHGLDHPEKGHSICNTGFVIPGKHTVNTSLTSRQITDAGFFGSGIYFSSSPKYAVNVYSRRSGHVLLTWVSMTEPYPVTRRDFEKKTLQKKGAYAMYNAHYIPVTSHNPSNPFEQNYYPTRPGEKPDCDEIVVFQRPQTLTRFWIELQPDLLLNPSTVPSTNEELADLIFNILEHPLIRNDVDLQKSLKDKAKALLIFGEESFLSSPDDQFYETMMKLFKTDGEICSLAKKHLIELNEKTPPPSPLLTRKLAPIEKLIEQGFFLEAWQNLCLANSSLFSGFDPLRSPLYERVSQLLPYIPWGEKKVLFDKIIHPIRILGSRSDLERNLARWFCLPQHELVVRKEDHFQELYLNALSCYGRALKLSQNEELHQEASKLLAKPLFQRLNLLNQSIDKALGEPKIRVLKKHIRVLSTIRKFFCLSKEDRERLIPLYRKIVPAFYQLNTPSSEIGELIEGQSIEDTPLPPPYSKICLEALSSWETTFEKEQELTLFADLLATLSKKLEEKGTESLFSLLTSSAIRDEKGYFSPSSLLKRLLDIKRDSKGATPSFLEIAFHRVSQEEEDSPQLISLVEGASKHLILKNSSPEEYLKLYRILSTGPTKAPFRQAFLFSLPKTSLFDQMASIPNRAGSRLSTTIEKNNFLEELSTITQEEPSSVAVRGPFQEVRYLKPHLIQQVIDNEGNIQRHYSGSLHQVARLRGEGFDLHLKQKPSHPLLEYGIYSLSCRLAGRGIPPSELIRLEVTLENQQTKIYPVLISKTVVGKNLNQALEENPNLEVNPKQLTEMILLGLLTRPGDGRASNFILTPENELYSVDNDVSFVEPIFRGWTGETIQFSSIVHCLKPVLLDEEVFEAWRSFNPELLFREWVDELIEKENHYLSLFSEEERKALYQENEELQFIPQLVLRAGTITTIYTQFHQILGMKLPVDNISILRKLISLNDSGTINQSGDRLYLAYSQAKGTPSEKLRFATGRKQEKSFTTPQALQASIGKIPSLEEIEKRELFSLDRIKEEFLTYTLLKQGCISLRGVKGREVLEVDFSRIQKSSQQHLEREELVLKGLSLLFETNPPGTVIFKNSITLTVEKLKPFIHRSLIHLELHNCPHLDTFQENGIFKSWPLKLPSSLRTLELIDCASLVSVKIEGRYLDLVKISNSLKLSTTVLDINFYGRISILGIGEDKIDTMLENGFHAISRNQELAKFEKEITDHPFIREMILLKESSIKRRERMRGSFILEELEKKHGWAKTKLESENSQARAFDLGNKKISDDGAKALARCLYDGELTHLNLERNQLSKEGIDALIMPLRGSNLKVLNLSNNRLGDHAMVLLAKLIEGSSIVDLNLESTQIEDIGASALAEALEASNLKKLNLGKNRITKLGAIPLAASLKKSQLKELNLRANNISQVGVVAILKALKESQLTAFDLGGNQIGDFGAKAFGDSIRKSNLVELYIGDNWIQPGGAKNLAESIDGSGISHLYLNVNQIGNEGIKAIAQVIQNSQIRRLDLASNEIGDLGAVALGKALENSKITQMNLNWNYIHQKGGAALSLGIDKSPLTHLSLNWNKIGDEGMEAIIKILPTSKLSHLELASNELTKKSILELAEVLHMTSLTVLNLALNKLGDEGVIALAKVMNQSNLIELHLEGNQMGSSGAIAMANSLKVVNPVDLQLIKDQMKNPLASTLTNPMRGLKLKRLNLEKNSIGLNGVQALQESIHKLAGEVEVQF